jgi:hypothetical protein
MALGVALGEIENGCLRVLRMIRTVAIGGDAFADDLHAFNRVMNWLLRRCRRSGNRLQDSVQDSLPLDGPRDARSAARSTARRRFWFLTASRSRPDGLSGFVGRPIRGRVRSEAEAGVAGTLKATEVIMER